jgi:hypothetical protein
MKLPQLITCLQALLQAHPREDLDVEVEIVAYETTGFVDSVHYVESYEYENASRMSPTVLLKVYE